MCGGCHVRRPPAAWCFATRQHDAGRVTHRRRAWPPGGRWLERGQWKVPDWVSHWQPGPTGGRAARRRGRRSRRPGWSRGAASRGAGRPWGTGTGERTRGRQGTGSPLIQLDRPASASSKAPPRRRSPTSRACCHAGGRCCCCMVSQISLACCLTCPSLPVACHGRRAGKCGAVAPGPAAGYRQLRVRVCSQPAGRAGRSCQGRRLVQADAQAAGVAGQRGGRHASCKQPTHSGAPGAAPGASLLTPGDDAVGDAQSHHWLTQSHRF